MKDLTVGRLLMVLALVLILAGCGLQKNKKTTHSMYYWSTTLNITPEQKQFLRKHHVKRLYVRYFDVVTDTYGRPQPNATISFHSPMPKSVEVVPTVFILNDCMKQEVGDLADKLLRRILQMNETHDVGKVKEIQIDCDWTKRTQKQYFAFLEELHQKAQEKHIQISTTIRLHQLAMTPPPVDHGTLMIYNTGDVTDFHAKNPILALQDVKPYLRYLKNYRLPLNAAYPIFTWQAVFRAGQFVGILHADDELPITSSDTILTHAPNLQEILSVRKAVASQRAAIHQEVILFDLSNKNINRFNTDDYEKIFND